MIDLSPKALAKFTEILAADQDKKYVRFGVIGGGCSGLQYQLALTDHYEPEWSSYEFNNIHMVVDPISLIYVDGTIIDYFESLTESGFTFSNPNVKTGCGCGKSFSV